MVEMETAPLLFLVLMIILNFKLGNARGTGERTVSYTHDPIHWRTKPIQDIMRESKDEESESE